MSIPLSDVVDAAMRGDATAYITAVTVAGVTWNETAKLILSDDTGYQIKVPSTDSRAIEALDRYRNGHDLEATVTLSCFQHVIRLVHLDWVAT